MEESREWTRATRVLLTLASLIVVVAGLSAAQAILIPVLLALLLAILCSPAVFWLRARRVPTVIAVLIVVLVLLAVFSVFGAVVGGSINGFMDAAPRYQERIDALGTSGTRWLRAQGVDVGEIDASDIFQAGSLMGYLGKGLSALLSTVSSTFMVTLILVFMLLEGVGLPVKVRAALGSPEADFERFTKAAREIQKYLGLKTAISAATGLLIGTWVAVLGLDFALTWGFLAFLLNFIPNIGSIIAAVPAVLLALVQLGPGQAVLVAAGFVVVNVVLGNILEPQLMGRTLGMSTLVIFLSLIFWGWLWGPVGMFLSVPLTMILKIGMENSQDLKPIAIMLDSPRAARERLLAAAGDGDAGPPGVTGGQKGNAPVAPSRQPSEP
jgi:AI-2 transport protein TqsA